MTISKMIERIKGSWIKGLTESVVFIKSIKLKKMTQKKDTKFVVLLPKLDRLNAPTII